MPESRLTRNGDQLEGLEESLRRLLVAELGEIIRAVGATKDETNQYLVTIPDPKEVDLGIEDLASLVARSSNAFGRLARLAGMARAYAKIEKGRYDRAFKSSRKGGSNQQEREALAMESAAAEHRAMVFVESIVELADALETAARIASESARKIFPSATNQQQAARREEQGAYADRDFTGWSQ